MPDRPPPLMGSPPQRRPDAAFETTTSRMSEDEDGSVISAGQISAPVSSKATSRQSVGSTGRVAGRKGKKERKIAPRPSETGRTLADLY
jgi:hypothetical protein